MTCEKWWLPRWDGGGCVHLSVWVVPTGEPTPVSQEGECVNTSDKGIPAPRGALEATMTNKKRITDTRQEKL